MLNWLNDIVKESIWWASQENHSRVMEISILRSICKKNEVFRDFVCFRYIRLSEDEMFDKMCFMLVSKMSVMDISVKNYNWSIDIIFEGWITKIWQK